MTTIAQAAAAWRLARERFIEMQGDSIVEEKAAVLDVIRDQLLEGKDSTGEYLTPRYSEDPYFKKPGAAQRYASWKKRLFPGDRPEDVPNLIITGVFHDAINLDVSGNVISYSNNASFGPSVLDKYGSGLLGLNEDGKAKTWHIIRPLVIDKLVEVTGCGVG